MKSNPVNIGKLYLSSASLAVFHDIEEQWTDEKDIEANIRYSIQSLFTESTPEDLQEALSAYFGDYRAAKKRVYVPTPKIAESIEELRESDPIKFDLNIALEKVYSRLAQQLKTKEGIMQQVPQWFSEDDREVDQTMLMMERFGEDAFVEMIEELIEENSGGLDIDGQEIIMTEGLIEAWDQENSGLTVSAALRRGITTLLAWRIENPTRGFLMDGDMPQPTPH